MKDCTMIAAVTRYGEFTMQLRMCEEMLLNLKFVKSKSDDSDMTDEVIDTVNAIIEERINGKIKYLMERRHRVACSICDSMVKMLRED